MCEKKSRIWTIITIVLALAAAAAVVAVVCKKVCQKKKLKAQEETDELPENEDSDSDVEELAEIDGADDE